jgi:hypothetical protein
LQEIRPLLSHLRQIRILEITKLINQNIDLRITQDGLFRPAGQRAAAPDPLARRRDARRSDLHYGSGVQKIHLGATQCLV